MSEPAKKTFFSTWFERLKKTVGDKSVNADQTASVAVPGNATIVEVVLELPVAAVLAKAAAPEPPLSAAVKTMPSGPLNLSGSIHVSGPLNTLVVKLSQTEKPAEKKAVKRGSGKLTAAQAPQTQAESWSEHALAYLSARRFDKALECAEQALRLDAESGSAWHCRGAALLALQRAPEAAQALQRAVTLRPANAEAWALFGRALLQLELYQPAVECCASALRYAPSHSEALLCQARAYGQLQQPQAACAAFDRALRQTPNDAGAWCEYGAALCRVNQEEAALECYERVAQIHPTQSENWLRLANFLCLLGRPAEAMAGYRTALELAPQDAEIWLNRGLALAAMSRQEDAAKSYQRVLELKPNDNAAIYQMALTHLQRFLEALEQGRVFYAKEHWQRGVALGRQTALADWHELELQYLQMAAALGHQRLVKALLARLAGNALLAPLDCALDFLLTHDQAKVTSLPTHIRRQVNASVNLLNPLIPCPVE